MKIFNSWGGKKQLFKPLEPGTVSIYVCGMTTYDFCHVGHARVMVVFDMITRYMRSKGLKVNYIRNITDIDDKIIKRAHENGEEPHVLAQRFIDAMHEDQNALNIYPPDAEPRATEHIPQIIAMIERLLTKQHAYIANNGDVFYQISTFPNYGRLSGKNIAELRAGERVAIQAAKKDPLDFVLWKQSKPDEPAWESPWGPGRPGWHIECSAMSINYLGAHFDIHGGGQDLQFPHHENEIAQSQGATGKPFANIWMHNGFVRLAGEKMSKSQGNFFNLRDLLRAYKAEEIRFFILASHYRSPLNYAQDRLIDAKAALKSLYIALRDIEDTDTAEPIDQTHKLRFNEYMDDDFNTPKAFALLHELAHEINRIKREDYSRAKMLAATLKQLANPFGLLQENPQTYLQRSSDSNKTQLGNAEIQDLIEQREHARQEKRFAESDRLRKILTEAGIRLEDTKGGTLWQRF